MQLSDIGEQGWSVKFIPTQITTLILGVEPKLFYVYDCTGIF